MRKLPILVAATLALAASGEALAADPARNVTIYKSPQCGCCDEHAEHLRGSGFEVTVKSSDDVVAMSRAAGIPDALQGCHLSLIDGYAVSGHVPVGIIERLLAERPTIKGITLPGMPMGSPGMPGPKQEPFTIYAVGKGPPMVYAVE